MPSAPITIYHNPRCSKSRQTLQLLRDQGIEPRIVDYLNSPPTPAEVAQLLRQLGIEATELVRAKECQELGVDTTSDATVLVEQIASHPKIMQRPIVVANGKARLGRPPESVLEIL